MTALLTEILELLGGGIVTLSGKIGAGLQALVTDMFLVAGEGGTQTLSVFGGLIIIFAGITLAINLGRMIYSFLTSLGN